MDGFLEARLHEHRPSSKIKIPELKFISFIANIVYLDFQMSTIDSVTPPSKSLSRFPFVLRRFVGALISDRIYVGLDQVRLQRGVDA